MNEWVQFLPLQDITVNLIILAGGYLVFTRKVIWHSDFDRLEKEKDEWKELALRLLTAGERLTAQNEVIVSKTVGSDEGDGDHVVS